MTAKRKILFSFTAIGLFITMAIVSVGVAIAAINANVNSGFSISYTAKNVIGTVAGTYRHGNEEKNMTVGGVESRLTYGTETAGGGNSTPLAA